MADADLREILRQELAPLKERLDRIEAYSRSVPILGEAIATLQRDSRLLRAAMPRDNQGENRATIRMRKAPGMG
jgi:hypothetical protein